MGCYYSKLAAAIKKEGSKLGYWNIFLLLNDKLFKFVYMTEKCSSYLPSHVITHLITRNEDFWFLASGAIEYPTNKYF